MSLSIENENENSLDILLKASYILQDNSNWCKKCNIENEFINFSEFFDGNGVIKKFEGKMKVTQEKEVCKITLEWENFSLGNSKALENLTFAEFLSRYNKTILATPQTNTSARQTRASNERMRAFQIQDTDQKQKFDNFLKCLELDVTQEG